MKSRAFAPTAALCAVVLAAGACTDGAEQLPTSATLADQVGVGPSCSTTDLRKAAEAFFGKQAPQVSIAQQYNNRIANTAAVTGYAYDLFAAIAAKRNLAALTSAEIEAAAMLSVHIMACSDLIYTDPSLPGVGDAAKTVFSQALGEAGTYEVRGGGTETAALARDGQAGLNPPNSFATWFGGRTLILGRPYGSFTTEMPGGYAYDWSFVRPRGSAALTGQATIALCTDDAPESVASDELRLQHLPLSQNGNIIPYLAAGGPIIDCGFGGSARLGASGPAGGRLLAALQRLVLPEPLHAAAALAERGPVSGLLGSFSPVEIVFPGAINLAFTQQPVDVMVDTPVPVAVSVKGNGGTPWEGVEVRLSAAANNGQPLELCGNVDTTNAAGLAEFPNLRLTKPGGAYLVATTVEPGQDVDVTSYSQATAESNRFVVGPGTGTSPCL